MDAVEVILNPEGVRFRQPCYKIIGTHTVDYSSTENKAYTDWFGELQDATLSEAIQLAKAH